MRQFVDSLSEEHRRKFGTVLVFLISLVVCAVALVVLLWIDTWWPQRLIPWIPLDRL